MWTTWINTNTNRVAHCGLLQWFYYDLLQNICLIYYDLMLCLLHINNWFNTIYLSVYYHLLRFHLIFITIITLPFITIYYKPPKW